MLTGIDFRTSLNLRCHFLLGYDCFWSKNSPKNAFLSRGQFNTMKEALHCTGMLGKPYTCYRYTSGQVWSFFWYHHLLQSYGCFWSKNHENSSKCFPGGQTHWRKSCIGLKNLLMGSLQNKFKYFPYVVIFYWIMAVLCVNIIARKYIPRVS